MKTYYYNKSALVFICASALLIFSGLVLNAFFQRHLGFVEMLVSLLCLLLLTFSSRYLAAAYKQIPALTINSKGIHDHGTGLTFHWRDIQSYKFNKTPVSSISVSLNNPEEYISKIKNPFTRVLKKLINNHHFSLNISLLKEQDERILDHIEYYDLEFQRAFMESL